MIIKHFTRAARRAALVIPFLAQPIVAGAQSGAVADSLIARALAANPAIRAAEAQLNSARARIAPAGAWADPMLMAGIQNLPISRQAAGHGATTGPEPMTMKMIGVAQTIPYPGKTSLRARVARSEASVAEARAAIASRAVRQDVLDAYYDLVAARTSLGILQRQRQLAAGIIPATEARYVSGSAAQVDVLKARTEASLLAQEQNALVEEERTALARLNAVLDQPSTAPVSADSFPEQVVSAAPVALLDSLQALALRTNPRLTERRAMVAVQAAQAELAAREYMPDFDVTLQYGQRDRLPDMITAMVSVPIPVQRGRKQNATTQAARSDLAAAEAELRVEENTVRSEIARAYAATERHRANLALLERAILPQSRATFASASATYQAGRGELLGVLDAMRAQFATEMMYVRALADFAKSLGVLEALVGREVAP